MTHMKIGAHKLSQPAKAWAEQKFDRERAYKDFRDNARASALKEALAPSSPRSPGLSPTTNHGRAEAVQQAVEAAKEKTTYAVDNEIEARETEFEEAVAEYNESVEGPTGGPSEGPSEGESDTAGGDL